MFIVDFALWPFVSVFRLNIDFFLQKALHKVYILSFQLSDTEDIYGSQGIKHKSIVNKHTEFEIFMHSFFSQKLFQMKINNIKIMSFAIYEIFCERISILEQ